jgi:very-short-patch-repair endonuclease
MLGYQFMRQKPIDNFIVDFYCSKLHLVIEIDGITHDGKQNYDQIGENKLKATGFVILRFDGHYVVNNLTGVLQTISDKIMELEKRQSPTPLY